ncbi:PIN domain-containing protein [Roseburia hominis]
MRVLIDTNIILDYILNREPYGEQARRVVKACEESKLSGCIAAHTVSNMFYILRKEYTVEERRELLLAICELFDIEGVDANKIQNALKNDKFSDFEDCLQMECAKTYHADYIITRNAADFAASAIPCIEPGQMCILLENNV